MPLIQAICPSCSAALDTPYRLLGAGTRCDTCESVVVPRVIGVQSNTGCEISFGSFVKLLTHAGCRERALPLIARWFPEVRALLQSAPAPAPGSAEEVVLLRIHDEIQTEPERQAQLYNLAMGLWR